MCGQWWLIIASLYMKNAVSANYREEVNDTNIRQKIADSILKRSSLLSSPQQWLINVFGGPSTSGAVVTENTAMRVTAVYVCIRTISETIASLPLPVYKKMKPRGKQRAPDHPLYEVLHDQANDEMTAFQLLETMTAHVLSYGNAYAYIERDGGGRVRALWPMLPDRTYCRRNDQTKKLEYVSTDCEGHQVVFAFMDVLHFGGLGFNGLTGYSPIKMMAETIGLNMTLEEHAGRFFSNGAKLGTVITHPGQLSDAAYKRLKESFAREHEGTGNAYKTKILEEGMTITPVSIPNDQAQFLESRNFQKRDIYSIFRIPPHMVGDLERATFSNIEQQSIEFVVHCIRPWLVRFEKAMRMKLLTPSERKTYEIKFVVDGLLRGDQKSRYEAYAIGKQQGFLTTNMIMELEDQNPVEGGDDFYVPVNMMPARMAEDFWKAKGGVQTGQKQSGNTNPSV